MKALVYENPRTMNMRDVPIPVPAEDEVLVRVSRAGICGSELSGYLGHNSLRKPPLVMGHEFAGIVERTGSQVSQLQPGDRVTANPLVTCGSCSYCRTGRSQLCRQRQLLGAHRPGAFAEFVAVPARNVFKLDDAVSFEEGAFAEPFACAIHVCRLLALAPTDRLILYGAGPIGLFALQAAQAYGIRDAVVVDLNEARLEIAEELGGIAVTGLERSPAAAGEFDAAIDAVGAGATRLGAVRAVRAGGRVVFTGLHEAESKLPINDMIRGEIATIGAFAYSEHDFATAVSWIAQGRVSLLPWTVTSPLEEGGACFEKLVEGPGKVAKILLTLE
ncbi:zinc-dependent alcohol dehydrogenase [Paenibacillus flagellatus]|uniref:Alcohol dehydrogenase n=1 Tax=Paenibacillus flagellatus TaxID=2211139 RepID=A0A2V5K4R6_9BACL|nr:alcohol dehydrogenase catalytic domain-containing protein [Paenibacillus flagellatus]PYI54309.1 alcohol dehydrogenase [Paenibacillus flagellatus]